MGAIAKLLFGISPRETTVEKRKFRGGDSVVRERIERIGGAFTSGYHHALLDQRPERFVPKLEQVESDYRGFAYEGAAMGLALLDRLTPWRRDRLQTFLTGAGEAHSYMVHVGIGWVTARFPGRIENTLTRLDPLLRWLVLDGYGFHEGYFHWPRYLGGQPIPKRVSGYGAHAFDQGLGRSLWFVDGGDVANVAQTIRAFPHTRQADLWSGIGLACVYAGEVNETALNSLREASGAFRPQLAQGAAFAAKARWRAGNPTAYTDRACRAICGLSGEAAAALTDAALENLPTDHAEPPFEVWRRRIQEHFTQGKELKR